MPSTQASGRDQVWLKKHLNVWKTKSTEAEAMRMKAYEKVVSKALNKAKYRHITKCKTEVLNAVKIYRGLSPQFEAFIFDNGDEKQLLNLHGTIPVEYKGSTYNIPVCLWFLHEYPNTAPMGFVVPTKDMQLKVSNYVDHTGKMILTYLNTWHYPESNLLGLIQACREAFGSLPPVFAKIPRQSSTTSQRSNIENETNDEDLDHERVTLMNRAENVIKEQFLEEFHKTKAELQTLHSTSKDLLDGQEDIESIEAEIDSKLAHIDSCLADLNFEKDKLEKALQQINELNPEALDSDKGVIDTNEPIHGQIVMCFAQDAALSDAIYHMGEGFHHGLFPDLDSYLKKVRNLSRQQFYLRATMIKARQVCGLEQP